MKFTTRSIVLVAGLSLVIFGFLIYFGFGFPTKLKLTEAEELPPAGSRLLIVAPHCDDETLGTGILIHRALKAKNQVKVVMVTNGDGFTMAVDEDFFTLHPSSKQYREFGIQRQNETLAALKSLGLKDSDVIFLGYPDTGIAHLWIEFWDPGKMFFSKFTQTNISPYKDSFNKYAPYNGSSLLSDLGKVVDNYKPTDIYFPHPNDRHPDHWGVNAFVKYLLEEKRLSRVKQHLYLVHRGNWPLPRIPRPYQSLTPPVKLIGLGTEWRQFVFQPGETILKKSAILKYTTQIRAMKNFLLAFVRSSELFGQYPDFRIPTNSKMETISNNDFLAIDDPHGDTVTGDVSRSGDVTGIYSYVIGKKWVLELSVASSVEKDIVYRINTRLFPEKGQIKRFDISYYQGLIHFEKNATNSITTIPGLKTEIVNGRWRLTIPMEYMKDIKAVFLNADSSIGHFNVDKTAWRMLRFKNMF